MGDVLFVAVVVSFFAAALLFVRGCDALTRNASDAAPAGDEELTVR